VVRCCRLEELSLQGECRSAADVALSCHWAGLSIDMFAELDLSCG
jgi:hypothetical protein